MAAWRDQDRATLERILAPDFSLVLSSDPSQPFLREAWLALAFEGYFCASFNYDSMAVQIIEPFAIVASRYRQEASVRGVDRSGQFFLTDVWRRVGSSWQVVTRYSSYPEPSGPSTHFVHEPAPGAAGEG